MKLTDDDVRVARQIRRDEPRKFGLVRLLAREFGVSVWYMRKVLAGAYR